MEGASLGSELHSRRSGLPGAHEDEWGQGKDGQALLTQHFWVLQTQPQAPRVALAAHLLPLSPAPHLPNEDTQPASRSSSHACLGKASLGPAALAQVELVLGSGSPGLAGRDQRSRRLRTQVGRSRGQGKQGSQDSQLQTPQMLTGLMGLPFLSLVRLRL